VLLELGKDGAVLKLELDEGPAEFEKYFLLRGLGDNLLEFLLDLLAELVALGEFAGVVVAAGEVAVDDDLPEAVDVLEDVLAELSGGRGTSSMSTHLLRASADRS
jgi:hypothetical protein